MKNTMKSGDLVESKGSNSRKFVTLIFGIALSIGILWFLSASLNWTEVYLILKEVDISYVLIWCLIFILAVLLRSYRWGLLFPTKEKLPFLALYDASNIGNLASMILPLRAGEFLRPLFFSRWTSVPFGRAFASVVIERVFDVCGMFLIFFIFVYGYSDIPHLVNIGAQALGSIALIIAVGMFFAYWKPILVEKLVDFGVGLLGKVLPRKFTLAISQLAKDFIAGLKGIENSFQLLTICFLTSILWLLYALSFQVAVIALGESASFAIGAVSCVFVGLFIAAPSAPGFFGTFHAGCVAALSVVFAYPDEFSFAFAILAHSLQVISTISIGLLSLFFRGLNFSSLSKN